MSKKSLKRVCFECFKKGKKNPVIGCCVFNESTEKFEDKCCTNCLNHTEDCDKGNTHNCSGGLCENCYIEIRGNK